MYGKEIKEEYCRWLKMCADEALCAELKEMGDRSEDLLSAFGSELSFGTGGLRGKIGVGTAKMNVYTVARATAGLAKYLKSNGGSAVAIGYDTRRYSRKFAEISAFVLSTFGIRSYVYSSPLPTPMLSYAVRELKLSAGIMITASHNPAIYNGYKVYGSDGCQITDRAADEILSFIKDSDYFEYNICESLGALLEEGIVEYIKEETYNNYLNEVSRVVPGIDKKPLSDVKIVYTPLNGTGYKPVTDALTRNGYNDLIIVVEQAFPDENFTTCPKPNPELDEALRLGLLQAKKENADVLIATDPDSDRVGIIAKNGKTYQRLTGNEVGLLLLDYVLSIKEANGSLPKEPIILKTIVTTPLAERIADARSIKVKNLLTGFKYIGEAIGELEDKSNFVFGFEESCGYLGGSYVRDKDGVYAALAVTKMTDYYKSQGISLPEKLESIYKKYGYCKDRLISHEFDSADGKNRISGIMELFRTKNLPIGITVAEKFDYLDGIDGLPVSDVLQFTFAGGDSLTVRPSGTEPKIKFYYYTIGKTSDEADDKMERLVKLIEDFID